jgi:hypothetical protein
MEGKAARGKRRTKTTTTRRSSGSLFHRRITSTHSLRIYSVCKGFFVYFEEGVSQSSSDRHEAQFPQQQQRIIIIIIIIDYWFLDVLSSTSLCRRDSSILYHHVVDNQNTKLQH